MTIPIYKNFRRKPLRLSPINYRGGWFFVTICTREKINHFGSILHGKVDLTEFGKIAKLAWNELPRHHANVSVEQLMVMPNHVHGVLAMDGKSTSEGRNALGAVIGSYKSGVSRMCRHAGAVDFAWQRGYFDEIIRNDSALEKIRKYIAENPLRWELKKLSSHERFV